MKRKTAAPLLSGLLAAAVLTLPAAAFEDTDTHWAQGAVERWADSKVVSGYSNGKFGPDDSITRAQMAVILNNLFGWTQQAKNTFTDLPADSWYTPAVLRANASGVMLGSGTQVRPDDPITREEAAVLLARALRVSGGEGKTFTDSASISTWARDGVNAMSAHSYINGIPAGSFAPGTLITRGETVTILDQAVTGYLNESGNYDGVAVSGGVVIVKASGVTLRNAVIAGDLIIAPGVSGGAQLQNVTVAGRLIVQSGGGALVTVGGGSQLGQVLVEGKGASLTLTGSTAQQITVSGSGASVQGLPQDAKVTVQAGAENVQVNGHPAAAGSTVTAGKDVSVPTGTGGGTDGGSTGGGNTGSETPPKEQKRDEDGNIIIDFDDLLGN